MVFSSILTCLLAMTVLIKADCNFDKHHETSGKKGNAEIAGLKGHRYTASDNDYTYDIGICTSAIDDEQFQGVGVIQKNRTSKLGIKKLGMITNADIMAGTDWVMLTYNGGEKYGSHCMGGAGEGGEERRAKIMFICDKASVDVNAIQPVIVEEQNDKEEGCYYLFEINTAAICKEEPMITLGMSTGSILIIVFFSVAGFYLLAGMLYKRFVLKAKGIEQIPNIAFWTDFGNLEADGCDLVCRSKKSRQPREYKGIGDEQLGDSDHSHDDGLLPM